MILLVGRNTNEADGDPIKPKKYVYQLIFINLIKIYKIK